MSKWLCAWMDGLGFENEAERLSRTADRPVAELVTGKNVSWVREVAVRVEVVRHAHGRKSCSVVRMLTIGRGGHGHGGSAWRCSQTLHRDLIEAKPPDNRTFGV